MKMGVGPSCPVRWAFSMVSYWSHWHDNWTVTLLTVPGPWLVMSPSTSCEGGSARRSVIARSALKGVVAVGCGWVTVTVTESVSSPPGDLATSVKVVVLPGHLSLESYWPTPSPSNHTPLKVPSTAQLTVVHCPATMEGGLAWRDTIRGGGGVVGVDVGGTRVAVGGIRVDVGEGGRVGVGVGGTRVVVAEGGRVGVEVGDVRVTEAEGAAYVGDGAGVSEACASWPTVTDEMASGPIFPCGSVALARMT
jgi:hypothetical protein